MKYVIIALAAGALVTGLKASYHWYESSEVEIGPVWTAVNPEPVDPELRQIVKHAAMIDAAGRSAVLNKIAARWTAASVVLGVASSIVGALAG
jgi:hypothetical protein